MMNTKPALHTYFSAPDGKWLDAAFLTGSVILLFFYTIGPFLLRDAALPWRLFPQQFAVAGAVLCAAWKLSPEIPFRQKLALPRGDAFPWKTVFLFFLFIYVFTIILSSAIRNCAEYFSIPLNEQALVQIIRESPLGIKIMLFASTVCVAPVCEELMFRHVFYSKLAKVLPFPAAAGLTALVFALLHGNFLHGPSLFFLSLILQLAYVRTRNLLVPVAIHTLFNLTSMTLILLLKISS